VSEVRLITDAAQVAAQPKAKVHIHLPSATLSSHCRHGVDTASARKERLRSAKTNNMHNRMIRGWRIA
jgi:hypothetical protein